MVHGWYRKLCTAAKKPGDRLVAYDTVPYWDPSPVRNNTNNPDDVNAVLRHFDVDAAEMLHGASNHTTR